MPARIIAGMVKMMPAAKDSPAEAAVCTKLDSKIDFLRNMPRRIPIAITAAGIEAETVMPAFRPR